MKSKKYIGIGLLIFVCFAIFFFGIRFLQNETFQNVIFDTLNKCVNDGLDKKLIQGVINSTEFHLKEADFGSTPKGLVYCTSSLNSWLYGGHPADHLEFQNILDDIKQILNDSFFE